MRRKVLVDTPIFSAICGWWRRTGSVFCSVVMALSRVPRTIKNQRTAVSFSAMRRSTELSPCPDLSPLKPESLPAGQLLKCHFIIWM